MGMPLPSHTYWTADFVRDLPDDGNRYELVHGELLVTPAPRPRHQRVQSRLFAALHQYLLAEPVGEVWSSPADISWSPDTLLQPDLFVVPLGEAEAERWSEVGSLLLVIEILSPGTARQDRFQKRRRYQETGVPLYWIVDADACQVEVWTPTDLFPAIERDRLRWIPAGARTECAIELEGIFRR